MPTATSQLATRSLQINRTFAAPCDEVFRAWTEAAALARWFAPSDDHTVVVRELDLRVGGSYRIEMRHSEGRMFLVAGTYREIKPPTKLSFTWRWEGGPEEETLVDVELRPRGEATDVILTHSLLPSDEERDKHHHGWVGCLDRLARILPAGGEAAAS